MFTTPFCHSLFELASIDDHTPQVVKYILEGSNGYLI